MLEGMKDEALMAFVVSFTNLYKFNRSKRLGYYSGSGYETFWKIISNAFKT